MLPLLFLVFHVGIVVVVPAPTGQVAGDDQAVATSGRSPSMTVEREILPRTPVQENLYWSPIHKER